MARRLRDGVPLRSKVADCRLGPVQLPGDRGDPGVIRRGRSRTDDVAATDDRSATGGLSASQRVSVIYGALSVAVPMIFTLLGSPLVILRMGIDRYGVLLVGLSVAALLGVHIGPALSGVVASDGLSWRLLCAAFGATFAMVVCMDAMVLLLGSSLARWLGAGQVLASGQMAVVLVIALLLSIGGVLSRALIGIGELRFVGVITGLVGTLTTGGYVVLARRGPTVLLGWNALLLAAAALAYTTLISRRAGVAGSGSIKGASEGLRRIAPLLPSAFFGHLLGVAVLALERLCVAAMGGTPAVSVLIAPILLFLGVHALVGASTAFLYESLVVHTDRRLIAYQLAGKIAVTGALIVLAGGVIGAPAIGRLVDKPYRIGEPVLVAHVTTIALLILLVPPYSSHEAMVLPRPVLRFRLLGAIAASAVLVLGTFTSLSPGWVIASSRLALLVGGVTLVRSGARLCGGPSTTTADRRILVAAAGAALGAVAPARAGLGVVAPAGAVLLALLTLFAAADLFRRLSSQR